jgi:hypothetical protein
LYLKNELKQKFVVNTSEKGYQNELGGICFKLKPEVCFECISGNTTGEMLDYMGFGSTLILYGLLSEQPAGGIKTIGFIGKS